MSSSPDLSKIIEVIMQNPELISQISSLVSKDSKSEVGENSPNEEITASESVSSVPDNREASTEPGYAQSTPRSRRNELLGALKPYLSENRQAAIDSMMSISDILSMMRR